MVDTDVFVSGLIVRGGSLPGRLVDALIADASSLVTSAELEAEVVEVVDRPKLTARYRIDPSIRRALLSRVAAAEHVIPLTPLPLTVRDPNDAKVVACALAGHVGYLISGDADLLILDGHPALGTLRILTAWAFLDLLG